MGDKLKEQTRMQAQEPECMTPLATIREQYLARVIVVCQAINDRRRGIFCQLQNVLMSKEPGHYHIVVPERTCAIVTE